MSEQEKNTGGNVSDGSSVVMIDSAARHKQPYRPTGMHESSPELHHKHSKAPAVPSVAEELKEAIESTETKEWKEFERADSSEKHKQTVAKKLSSSTKRRGSSPEAITLAPLEVETKKGTITPSPQPIPAQVSAVVSEESGLAMDKPAASDIEKKYDDDSITEEIESRTPEVVKRSSEWLSDTHKGKKKEISWNKNEYLQKNNLQEIGKTNRVLPLERKRSIGPCLITSSQFGGPSGITINIPKKSLKNIDDKTEAIQSIINITVSKKCLVTKSTSRLCNQLQGEDQSLQLKINNEPTVKSSRGFKGKLSSMGEKIRSAFNMGF